MKVCPNCGAQNSEYMSECYKCEHPITDSDIRRICTNCHETSRTTSRTCPICGGAMNESGEPEKVYSPYQKKKSKSVETWEIIVALLIPIVGIILGIIHFGKDEREKGKTLIIFSIAVSVICSIIILKLR